jgi:peptide-methionine (R)-S-oxide reductase
MRSMVFARPLLRWTVLVMLLVETLAFRSNLSRNCRISVVVPADRLWQCTDRPTLPSALFAAGKNDGDANYNDFVDSQRRQVWKKAVVQAASAAVGFTGLLVLTRPAWASSRSRSTGYAYNMSDDEWKSQLSPVQYNILREGGTERPGFSILEKEKRPGTFKCAGCGTPLFSSADKFNSGTGWPSFAQGLDGVEVESVDPITANLSGAESRCKTCGGHLGDVFRDGFLFQGTPAALTGKRFCIDGAALVFFPDEDGASPVRGDISAKAKEPTLPSFLDPPKITPRERS